MSEEKNGKVKVTIEIEVNEALMNASKGLMPRMGWMGPCGGMSPWKAHGMMSGQMPWSMNQGMQCPKCGEPMIKPSKEEVMEMLERKKKRLEEAIDHINKETERLKENAPEEKQ
jgi:hypothetical protein